MSRLESPGRPIHVVARFDYAFGGVMSLVLILLIVVAM